MGLDRMLSRLSFIKVNFSLDSELFIRNLLQDCEEVSLKKENVLEFYLYFSREK